MITEFPNSLKPVETLQTSKSGISEIHYENEVLLMTATIDVKDNPNVLVRDEKVRLCQYLCSLISWIKLTSINTIIFCENGNTSYDFAKVIDLAEQHGKTLEVLVFDGNRETVKQGGIGYGEGKILDYAIKTSQYLSDDVNFYKVTGKNFIANFDKIRAEHRNIPNVFSMPAWGLPEDVSRLRLMRRFFKRSLFFTVPNKGLDGFHIAALKDNSIKTIFYKSNVGFFRENLLNSYKKVRDRWGYHIEKVYFDDLFGKDFHSFLIDYKVVGKSGWGTLTDGLDFSEDIKNLAKTFD